MAKAQPVISHWYQLIENCEMSSLAYYQAVEAALCRREVPESKGSRIEYKERGLLSAKREYLRIVRGKHTFDICAAPFGTGFFFSWWLSETQARYGVLYLLGLLFGLSILMAVLLQFGFLTGIFLSVFIVPLLLWLVGNGIRDGAIDCEDAVLSMPLVGWLYERIFNPTTFYTTDTALMFQEAVHNAVMEVIDQSLAAKGLRALGDGARKPIMKAFAQSV